MCKANGVRARLVAQEIALDAKSDSCAKFEANQRHHVSNSIKSLKTCKTTHHYDVTSAFFHAHGHIAEATTLGKQKEALPGTRKRRFHRFALTITGRLGLIIKGLVSHTVKRRNMSQLLLQDRVCKCHRSTNTNGSRRSTS